MAALGDYTTTEAVRGCLGVDLNDMPDHYMVDSKLDVELKLDLDGWLPTHAALYAAGVAPGATAADVAKGVRIALYAQWFCAAEMAKRPLSVPQITTDGKAQIDRFKVDLEKVAALATFKVSQYRAELDLLVNGTAIPTGVISYVGIGVPSQDPITEGLQ